ncbi:MAG: hypothetical protein IKY90_10390 [Oscillospiraceae bacterium]|nr:hypothetical protein [Oscillospiraceae bacterium]
MNPWIIILLVTAAIVFILDYLFRRKKWKFNSKQEKISLLVNMFSVGPYIFLSSFGLLWGIVAGSPETAFGLILYKTTLMMGATFFAVAAVAVIMSLVFREKGKIKASIWINVIPFVYIALVLAVNSLAEKIL